MQRKYYISLAPQKLFYHLKNRELPEIPGMRDRDYISELYGLFDRGTISDGGDTGDDSPEIDNYKNNLCWKYIALIKEHQKIYTSSRKVRIELDRKILNPPDYQIFVYYSGALIEGIYAPFFYNDLKIHFRFSYYRSIFDFLKEKISQGVRFVDDRNLMELCRIQLLSTRFYSTII